ncbi:killer toxin subunits alpha beta [Fusarium sp. NRRL 25303]|nr:killer toxin subunits alpha beta [Fusarium sp. NRRL 25303]
MLMKMNPTGLVLVRRALARYTQVSICTRTTRVASKILDDTSKIDILNPDSIINKAIPKTDELVELVSKSYTNTRNVHLDAYGECVVTALSMPVFILQDTIESITKVKDIGEKQRGTKTGELALSILSILSIVFTVTPFAGSAASALCGAAMVAQAALIIDEADSSALGSVDIVKFRGHAPFSILGMLIGSTVMKVKGPRKTFKNAADVRRALKGNKLEAFSPEFRTKDEIVQSLLKKSELCSIAENMFAKSA